MTLQRKNKKEPEALFFYLSKFTDIKEVSYNICILNKGGENMEEFIKDPGGSKVISDPGTGIGIFDPGPGGGYTTDPGGGWRKEPGGLRK